MINLPQKNIITRWEVAYMGYFKIGTLHLLVMAAVGMTQIYLEQCFSLFSQKPKSKKIWIKTFEVVSYHAEVKGRQSVQQTSCFQGKYHNALGWWDNTKFGICTYWNIKCCLESFHGSHRNKKTELTLNWIKNENCLKSMIWE